MEKTYPSLEQRILAVSEAAIPPFHPSQYADYQGQRQFYDFLKTLYRVLLEDPLLLFSTLHEDGFYTRRYNRSSEGKPELYRNMMAARKKIEGLFTLLMTVGREGELRDDGMDIPREVRLNKKILALLEAAGLICEKHNGGLHIRTGQREKMFAVLRWMAQREDADLLRFAQGRFCLREEAHCYALEALCTIAPDPEVLRLFDAHLLEKGFTRIEYRDTGSALIELDYVKNYPLTKKELDLPVKDAWAERTHSGLSIRYDFYMEHPVCYCLRAPHMDEVLHGIHNMPPEVRRFILRWNKKCDGCRYCVQTDKTGSRPLRAVQAEGCALCPLFPGFNYSWETFDRDLMRDVSGYLDYIDRYFGEKVLH